MEKFKYQENEIYNENFEVKSAKSLASESSLSRPTFIGLIDIIKGFVAIEANHQLMMSPDFEQLDDHSVNQLALWGSEAI